MATRDDYFELLSRMAAARIDLADALASARPNDVAARDMLTNRLTGLEHDFENLLARDAPVPPDGGLGAVVGIGGAAAAGFGGVPTPIAVPTYEDALASERLYAVGDLYYCYQIERLGMFRAVNKLKELFRAGKLRLATGQGAFDLYRFDRKEVLRATQEERLESYSRVFGYTDTPPPRGAKANRPFHTLFTQFNLRVAELFRDKRIAETFRPGSGATDPSFGSVATVRRAGLDLRANLKRASHGDINVLTVELLQVIAAAYDILNAEDIRHQFGTDDGWDTLEEVLERYLGEIPVVSQRASMGDAGRQTIHWLGQNFIQTAGRTAFEALLQSIAERCEEWLTSAEALGGGRGENSARGWDANVVAFPGRRPLSA